MDLGEFLAVGIWRVNHGGETGEESLFLSPSKIKYILKKKGAYNYKLVLGHEQQTL